MPPNVDTIVRLYKDRCKREDTRKKIEEHVIPRKSRRELYFRSI
jgi:hypothetical protein